MFLSRKVEEQIKKLIVEGYHKEDILADVAEEHGQLQGISFFYDCCYNTICRELNINRKRGEELKPTKARGSIREGVSHQNY